MARNKAPRFIIHLAARHEPLCFLVSRSVRAAASDPLTAFKTELITGDDPQRTALLEAIRALRQIPEGTRVDLQTNHEYLVDGMTKWRTKWERRNWQTAHGGPVAHADLWKLLFAEVDARQVKPALRAIEQLSDVASAPAEMPVSAVPVPAHEPADEMPMPEMG